VQAAEKIDSLNSAVKERNTAEEFASKFKNMAVNSGTGAPKPQGGNA
jgi:hypothetical protein